MTTWSPSDMGRAMVAYVEHHARHGRRRADGITSEAFYRGGDNPESLRVWEATGTWADPRDAHPPASHAARDFAQHVAGMPLRDFMERWGAAPVRRTRASVRSTDNVMADARRLWA